MKNSFADPVACEDLAARGMLGNIVYALLWGMYLLFTSLPQDLPVFSYLVLAGLFVFGCGRAYYGFRFKSLFLRNPRSWAIGYHVSVLGIALSMGIAGTVVIYYYHDSWIAPAVGMLTAGVVGGGTFSVGTHRLLQIGYISFILLPVFITGLVVNEATAVFLAICHLVYFIYLVPTGGRMHKEYWRMHDQNILLEDRAEQLEDARSRAIIASSAKSDFVANMSHEIRTPLNSIIGMSEMLSETPLTQEQKEYVDTFRTSGDLLLGIINDILDFSKIEAGEMKLEEMEFDLFSEMEEISRIFNFDATNRGLKFRSEFSSDAKGVFAGDAVKIKHILVNLLGNALKFTESGEVELSVAVSEKNPQAIVFSVRDTGIGISEQQQSRIFDSFVQADASTRRKFGGTGLGLAIVKRLTQIMGGSLTLESKVGTGSCFTIELPLNRIDVESNSNNSGRSKIDRRPFDIAGCRILLVEDSIDNQNVVRLYLKDSDVTIVTAGNGIEALDQIDKQEFDLVLMDIEMPEMDGITATKEIRAGESGAAGRIPIIALTAHSFTDSRTLCLDAGCDKFLTKPIRKAKLLQSIDELLNIKNPRRELAEHGESPQPTEDTSVKGELEHGIHEISLDPDFEELIPDFMARKGEEIKSIVQAAEQKNFDLVTQIGHKMKGSSKMFGFDWLASKSEQLEIMGRANDLTDLSNSVTEIREYLNKVKINYRNTDSES